MGMMKYVEGLLGKNEQILWRARQHWIVLAANFVINLFIFVAIIVVAVLAGKINFLSGISGWILLALLIPICWFGWNLVQWWVEEYLVTTDRVVQTEGFINKRTKDSALEKINDITLVQSVTGRVLNYGDLAIITGSDVGTNVLRRLARPVDFKKTLLEQKQRLYDNEDLGHRPAATAESDDEDPLKKIAQLDDLRKTGAISEVEYQQAKAKLLAKL